MSGKSDNELMEALILGDEEALTDIINRWERPIKSFIYRFTQNEDWVDELAQETFVKVYLNCHRFDTNRKFSSWLYTIAANISRNFLRWKGRRPLFLRSGSSDDELITIADEKQKAAAEQAEHQERSILIKDSIAQLPSSQKTAVILHYYQGLSYEDIAEVLKCSPRGVETKLYRARKFLKRKLPGVLEDDPDN